VGARAADGKGPRATAPCRRALSGAEGAPARGGGGRARGLSRGGGCCAQNEERGARTRKRERGSTAGWCSGPVALGVGLTASSKDDDDGGATLDEEDGAARRRLGQDRRWRGEEKKKKGLCPL